jgi:hypothetical protein
MSFENRDEDKPVSDPESPQTTTGEPDVMRPIPDGGLQQSMPEWLRRPPAWRSLPKREAEPDEAVEATVELKETPEPAPAPVELPEPDQSEIDPRTLVDLADLPQWLQDVAARGVPVPPVTTDVPQPEEEDMTDPEKRLETESREERAVPFEPVDKKILDVPEQETKTYGGGKPASTGMSQPVMIGLGLVVLALIVILIFALM